MAANVLWELTILVPILPDKDVKYCQYVLSEKLEWTKDGHNWGRLTCYIIVLYILLYSLVLVLVRFVY